LGNLLEYYKNQCDVCRVGKNVTGMVPGILPCPLLHNGDTSFQKHLLLLRRRPTHGFHRQLDADATRPSSRCRRVEASYFRKHAWRKKEIVCRRKEHNRWWCWYRFPVSIAMCAVRRKESEERHEFFLLTRKASVECVLHCAFIFSFPVAQLGNLNSFRSLSKLL
jgi:hypothetical protein